MNSVQKEKWPQLKLPAICAPMFRISGIDLVIGACRAGVIGAFPALNARTSEELDRWLTEIADKLENKPQNLPAPYAVNLIVHKSNSRLQTDLELCVRHRVPLVISSVGNPAAVVDAVHGYGGCVYHDVSTVEHAKKAVCAGVDGLILLCAGSGGQTGTLNPFAFFTEVRSFWDGEVIIAGGISSGHAIRSVQNLGANLAYIGTYFMASQEAMGGDERKKLLIESNSSDVIVAAGRFGALTSLIKSTLEKAGITPQMPSKELGINMLLSEQESARWASVVTAGQGVGAIKDVVPIGTLIDRLSSEYFCLR
jgi:nitronate monooxygenase